MNTQNAKRTLRNACSERRGVLSGFMGPRSVRILFLRPAKRIHSSTWSFSRSFQGRLGPLPLWPWCEVAPGQDHLLRRYQDLLRPKEHRFHQSFQSQWKNLTDRHQQAWNLHLQLRLLLQVQAPCACCPQQGRPTQLTEALKLRGLSEPGIARTLFSPKSKRIREEPVEKREIIRNLFWENKKVFERLRWLYYSFRVANKIANHNQQKRQGTTNANCRQRK